MAGRCATALYGAALVTLPWAGVGVLKLVTGRDWGGGLQPSWLFLALATLCVIWEKGRAGSLSRDFRSVLPASLRRWWLLGTGAIFLAVGVSVVGLWSAPAGEPTEAVMGRYVKQVVQLVIMLVFAVWPTLYTRGSGRWSWTVKMLMIGFLFQVGYGALQGVDYYVGLPGFSLLDSVFTSNPSIFSGSGELYLGDAFRQVPRLRGTCCEPLYLGNYLLFLLPLTLIPNWSAKTRRLLAAALLILLFATWSRGAWLGLVIQISLGGTLFWLFRGGRSHGEESGGPAFPNWKLWLTGAAALMVVVPLLGMVTGWDSLLFPYRRLAQTFSGQDWSNLTRLYSMQAAWRAFLLSPLVGVGWGQFGWHFPTLVDPMGLQSQFTWPVVNNYPLLVLCETGLVGFLVFAGWALGLAKAFFRRLSALRMKSPDHEGGFPARMILLGTALGVFGVWAQLLTFSQYNLPHIWVILGLFLAALAETGPGAALPRNDEPGEPEW